MNTSLRDERDRLLETLKRIHEILLKQYRGSHPWPPRVGTVISLAELGVEESKAIQSKRARIAQEGQ